MSFELCDGVEEEAYRITPLGAAVAEALPDQLKVAQLEVEYWRDGKVPTSRCFPTEEDVRQWFEAQDREVASRLGKFLEERLCVLGSEAFEAAMDLVRFERHGPAEGASGTESVESGQGGDS